MKIGDKVKCYNGAYYVDGVIYKFLKSSRVQVRLTINNAICSFKLDELIAV